MSLFSPEIQRKAIEIVNRWMNDLGLGTSISDEGWEAIHEEADTFTPELALAVRELMEDALDRHDPEVTWGPTFN